jgi:hypothetical protein
MSHPASAATLADAESATSFVSDYPGLTPVGDGGAAEPGMVFSRLARHEAMPATEQVRAGRWRLRGPVTAVSIALVILAGAVTLALSAPGAQTCGVTVTSAARSHSPSQAPGCPAPVRQWRYLH